MIHCPTHGYSGELPCPAPECILGVRGRDLATIMYDYDASYRRDEYALGKVGDAGGVVIGWRWVRVE